MLEGLLKTKLFVPPLRRSLVARPRLMKKLAETFLPETRLTLICAPPGFGKTTVAASWLSAPTASDPPATELPDIHSAWLTLDENDNDPIRFWRYVDAALQTIDPRLGASIRPELFAPGPPPFHMLAPALTNDILSTGLEFVLVLDDYHVILNENIHHAVSLLIDSLPPLAHLVITTRSDPPLQLARRRARGELCELRAADLRFTQEETAHFINDSMHLGLTSSDVAALEARTEGWIAGLQLAAISLQDVTDAHAFVAEFQGDDRYVADYLIEEVLQRQPVEFQSFLLSTSVLDRMCGSLCDAVTGRSDSQSVLNALERANLFVTPLDNHREWFRYHRLFASLLRQRLLQTAGPKAIGDLKRRASQWHAAHGNVVDSVKIALSYGDFEQAASTIEASDAALFMGPELNSLRQWSEQLPEAVIVSHPRLILMAAWANHATGHIQQVERLVRLVEQAVGTTVDLFLDDPGGCSDLTSFQRSALLEGAVVQARTAIDELDLMRTFSLGERILPRLVSTPGELFAFNPPGNLRCVMLYVLGLAYEYNGDPVKAAALFAEAEADALLMKNPHIIALGAGHLGKMHMLMGQPEQARVVFQRAVEAASTFPPRSSAFWGLAQIGLGDLAAADGDLAGAEAHFEAGVELGKMWNSVDCLLSGMIALARLRAEQGDLERAEALLDELLARTASTARVVRPAVEAHRAEFHLQRGSLSSAAEWASTFDALHPDAHHLQWEQNALSAVKIWFAQGKRAEAEKLLARIMAEAGAAGRQAVVDQAQSILPGLQPPGSRQHDGDVLRDAISERELEVLGLMAQGLSHAEIARQLFLSPNTLKAHAQNIYTKLGVHNRMEAINKARESGLL